MKNGEGEIIFALDDFAIPLEGASKPHSLVLLQASFINNLYFTEILTSYFLPVLFPSMLLLKT